MALARATSLFHASKLVLDNSQVERPILGRYQMEEVIGKGAMGTVPKISRKVAIKTVAMAQEFEQQCLQKGNVLADALRRCQ